MSKGRQTIDLGAVHAAREVETKRAEQKVGPTNKLVTRIDDTVIDPQIRSAASFFEKDRYEERVSWGMAEDLKREAAWNHCGNPPKRVLGERPETAARHEREFFYGRFDPKNGICGTCHTVRALNGACEC